MQGRRSRRVDRARQPSRRVGERRRRSGQRRVRACSKRRARSASCASRAGRRSGRWCTPPGTARSRRCSGRPSGSSRTPRTCRRTPSRTSTPTATAAASLDGGLAHARAFHQRRRAGHQGSRDARERVEARAGAGDLARRDGRRREPEVAIARTCGSARSDRAPTSRRSSSTPAWRRSNLGFGGEDADGIYHSIYDDFYYYTHFLDTDFVYGRALAQTVGTAVIRLADADVLPFEFTNLADTVRTYVKDLQMLLKKRQEEMRERNRDLVTACSRRSNDPRRPLVLPKPEAVPPAMNFAPLENAGEHALRDARSGSARRSRRHAPKLAGNNRGLDGHQRRSCSRASSSCSTPPGCRSARGTGTCCTRPASTPATA